MITQLYHSKLGWGVGAVLHKWNAAATCTFDKDRAYIEHARGSGLLDSMCVPSSAKYRGPDIVCGFH